MEQAIAAGVQKLIEYGGGYILAALLIAALWFLDRRYSSNQKACDDRYEAARKEIIEQYEKRLLVIPELKDALGRSSTVLAALQTSVEVLNGNNKQLVTGFDKLTADIENNRERWIEKGDTWTRQLEDVRKRLEDLQGRSR